MSQAAANLIIGRLGPVTGDRTRDERHGEPARTSYGTARLGICPPPAREACPAGHTVDFHKCTFKLPEDLAGRLRHYARATGRFQYLVATDAIRAYLAELAPELTYPPEPPTHPPAPPHRQPETPHQQPEAPHRQPETPGETPAADADRAAAWPETDAADTTRRRVEDAGSDAPVEDAGGDAPSGHAMASEPGAAKRPCGWLDRLLHRDQA
ncbi:MAG: hypothetical protein KGY99_10620 [Phycisphaerae bacterium]|nr:hypothetical protein [Phycisphaerae bacterium]